MKKLLLGVITFALIITSCNKYADDFAALKDQIAALAVQVNGVIQLQADLTAAKAQITALQGVVATLPTATTVTGQFTALTTALAGVGTKIDAITTTLGAVATAGTATKAVVDKLAVDLAQMKVDKTAADKVMNDKLDALKVQLALTATSAEVKAIQAEILKQIAASAATTDANVNAKIAAAVEAINKVITDGLSATNANVNTKIADAKLALEQAIAASIVSINKATADGLLVTDGKIEAAKAALEALINGGVLAVNGNTDTKVAALEAALKTLIDAGNLATLAKIDATLLALQGDPSNADKTKLTIQGLQLALAAAQADITTILNSTAMYNGDVIINSDAAVDFFFGKLNQLAIVNGGFEVRTEMITAAYRAKLNTIMSKVQAVINGDVYIESVPGDNLSLPLLSQVDGNYDIWGADVNDPKIAIVAGWYGLGYDGAYESTSLQHVGNGVYLDTWGSNATQGDDDDWIVTSVNFPNLVMKVGAGIDGIWSDWDGNGTENTLEFPNAKSVVLGETTIDHLDADSALTVTIKTVEYLNGLIVHAGEATSLDLSACTTSDEDLDLNVADGGTVNLNKLVDCAYNVVIEGPTTVTIPLWDGVGGDLTSSTATTVTLAKYDWSTPATIPAVEHLTLGAVDAVVAIDGYPTLITANISGKTQTKWANCVAGVTSAVNPELTTLTLGGVMRTVNVANLPLLTSVTTSGSINAFTLDAAAKITGLTLGHKQFDGEIGYGGPGSYLTITNNPKLASLKPSALSKMRTVDIHDNALLASIDLSSYGAAAAPNFINNVAATTIIMHIYNNKLTGTYTDALPLTLTMPYQEAKIVSADLKTLKAYVAAIMAVTGNVIVLNLRLDVDDVDAVTAGNQTLGDAMLANSAVSTVITDAPGRIATTAISTKQEMALIQ